MDKINGKFHNLDIFACNIADDITLGEVVENLNNFEQIHLTLRDNAIKID